MEKLNIIEVEAKFVDYGIAQFWKDMNETGFDCMGFINWDDEGLDLDCWIYDTLRDEFGWSEAELDSGYGQRLIENLVIKYCDAYNSKVQSFI